MLTKANKDGWILIIYSLFFSWVKTEKDDYVYNKTTIAKI